MWRRPLGLLLCILGLLGCGRTNEPNHREGSWQVALKPPIYPAQYTAKLRQLVYVPVYSSIYWGFDRQTTELAATLSVRNVSLKQILVVHSVKYYDSEGKELREYVTSPSTLGPMATADFVIQRRDTTGGPGANFLVDWSSAADIDDPVIEAIMIGQHGNAGISFTSIGRALPKASAELARPAISK